MNDQQKINPLIPFTVTEPPQLLLNRSGKKVTHLRLSDGIWKTLSDIERMTIDANGQPLLDNATLRSRLRQTKDGWKSPYLFYPKAPFGNTLNRSPRIKDPGSNPTQPPPPKKIRNGHILDRSCGTLEKKYLGG